MFQVKKKTNKNLVITSKAYSVRPKDRGQISSVAQRLCITGLAFAHCKPLHNT